MIALLMLAKGPPRRADARLPRPAAGNSGRNGPWTEECWTDTRGGLMIGSGRTGMATRSDIGNGCGSSAARTASVTFYGSPKGRAGRLQGDEGDGKSITFVNAPTIIRSGSAMSSRTAGSMPRFARRWQQPQSLELSPDGRSDK